MIQEKQQLNVRVSKVLYRELKKIAVDRNMKFQDYLILVLSDIVRREHEYMNLSTALETALEIKPTQKP